MTPTEIRLERLLRNFRIMAEALAGSDGTVRDLNAEDHASLRSRVAIVAMEDGDARTQSLVRILSADWSVKLLSVQAAAGPDQASREIEAWLPRAASLAAAQDCDLVLVSGTEPPALLLGALIKDQRGCPLLLDLRDGEAIPEPAAIALADIVIAGREDLAVEHGGSLLRTAPPADATEEGQDDGAFAAVEFSEDVNRARLVVALRQAQRPDASASADFIADAVENYRLQRSKRIKAEGVPRYPARQGAGRPIYDIAVFWKQNDSGIYGRRSDMITKYLLRSGRVRKILHLDAPASLDHFLALAARDAAAGDRREQDAILRNFTDRLLHIGDDDRLRRRVFLSGSPGGQSLLGQGLPAPEAHVEFVRSEMREMGMEPSSTLAWVYPVVGDFAAIADAIAFRGVIADVVDDERAWATTGEQLQKAEANYREVLGRAQLTFTNCQPLSDALSDYAMDIRVVPNGAEFPPEAAPAPAVLAAGLRRPVIGYIGDLRNRIDWRLLREMAESRPDWTILLIGPGRATPEAAALGGLPNVALPGTVPCDEIGRWLAVFDVAIVPHAVNRITARMNPLKVYNYLAAGLPVVSTSIENLSGVEGFVRVAEGGEAFIAAVAEAIEAPRPAKARRARLMAKIGWPGRVSEMLAAIDEVFG